MWKIYIFDMDGTLIDAMEEHAKIFSQLLYEQFKVPVEKSSFYYHASAGNPLDEQFASCLKIANAGPIEKPIINNLVSNFWKELALVKAKSFPLVEETLKELKDRKRKLVISSGCTTEVVEAKLTSCNLAQYFDLLLGTDYDNSTMRKGVSHLNMVTKKFNIPEKNIHESLMVIGDAAHDIIIGKSFGATTVGVLNTYNKKDLTFLSADFIILKISEILSLQ